MKEVSLETKRLKDTIINAIQAKKGHEVVSLDLREVQESICDYFIICHGDSKRQADAIADHVMEKAKAELREIPRSVEGTAEKDWMLLDFVDIVVHVFYKPIRYHYNLEELWSDARVVKHDDVQKIV